MARYPNILCRVNNITPKAVVGYVNNLPKASMPMAAFYNQITKIYPTWKNNHRQCALQWGLYYEENGYYYPRFKSNISLPEADEYISNWLQHFVVPNPYSALHNIEPTNLVKLVYDYMKANPSEIYIHDILNHACKERVNSSLDILMNALNKTGMFNFTKDGLRYYMIAPKNGYKKKTSLINSNDIIKKLVKYFDEGPNASEELGEVTKYINNGVEISYQEIQKIPHINEVFKIGPVYNYKVTFTQNASAIYNKKYNMNEVEYFHLFDVDSKVDVAKEPRQQIYYGAPGTGKSYNIDSITKQYKVIRTTFHPDSDYSTFVGAYKPTMSEGKVYGAQGPLQENGKDILDEKISYRFVKQAFLKAYLLAWKKYTEAADSVEPQFLVIEEINRGNCAQIFGDLFQLLDRNSANNFSTYPVESDADIHQEINKSFTEKNGPYELTNQISIEGAVKDYTSNYGGNLSEDVQKGRIMLFPPNLYIWATMNTSDQSLFPIDSAFKRRWDWKYIPISNHPDENYKIMVNGNLYDWWKFLSAINAKIYDTTNSEDKELGYFFCKANKDKIITADKFLSKVIFYLWNDVFKDYGFDGELFKKQDDQNGGTLKFPDFFNPDGSTDETMVEMFLNNLDNTISREEDKIKEDNSVASADAEGSKEENSEM